MGWGGGGIKDNSKIIFSYFSIKTNVVTPHKNRLDQRVLMVGHKIYLNGEIWIISPKLYPCYLFLSVMQHVIVHSVVCNTSSHLNVTEKVALHCFATCITV